MDDAMVQKMKAVVQGDDVVRGIEAMQEDLDGLTRVERAVLACTLGHELAQEDLAELAALRGEDGRAWRRLCSSIGLRILPGGIPQVWTGDTLPPPLPGEAAADSMRGSKAGRWLQ